MYTYKPLDTNQSHCMFVFLQVLCTHDIARKSHDTLELLDAVSKDCRVEGR